MRSGSPAQSGGLNFDFVHPAGSVELYDTLCYVAGSFLNAQIELRWHVTNMLQLCYDMKMLQYENVTI